MKNLIPGTLISLAVMLMVSCSIGNSPKKTAEKFLTSFNQRNYEEARKYATPETIKLVDLMENLTKMAQPADSTLGKKITVMDEKVEGEVAYVTFQEEGSDQVETLKLKKIDGKWLAHVTKEDVAAKDLGKNEEEEGVMMETDSLMESPADTMADPTSSK